MRRVRPVLLAATLLLGTAAPALAAAQVRFVGEAGGASVRVTSWRDIPFRTVVRQQHDFSCGSAALATLLTYHYGRPTSEADAFTEMFANGDQALIRRVGFSMLDMKRFLAAHGLQSQGYRLNLEEVARAGVPVLVLINLGAYRHFVVIKGVSATEVLIGDPALGLRRMRREDFSRMWNGIALAISSRQDGKPGFNSAEEWTPWSRAPLVSAAASQSAAPLTANQFALYQITPIRVLADASAGGGL